MKPGGISDVVAAPSMVYLIDVMERMFVASISLAQEQVELE